MSAPEHIFCVVPDGELAQRIAGELVQAGFTQQQISVLLRQGSTMRPMASPGAATMADGAQVVHLSERETLVPEGVVVGAGAGGLLGGTLGWLAGIGSLAIPGVGPLIASGVLFSTLSGVAVGAILGGSAGMLVGLGLSEVDAKLYEERVKEGGVVISAATPDAERVRAAREIFERNGAESIVTTQGTPAESAG